MTRDAQQIRLFLCGDVMTGRGIDQILPHPGAPEIHETWMRSARGYVDIAEARNGPIPRPVGFDYIWGDALDLLERAKPDFRIVNLETSVTSSDGWWAGKGIHYRMHPANVTCLTAASIDCCVLANNHVLDWGYAGLDETLTTLHAAGLATAGAGRDREAARAPAILDSLRGFRVLVFAYGSETSGIPREWAAGEAKPGLSMLEDLPRSDAERIAADIAAVRQPGDIVIASLHWGGNWGYSVPTEQRRLAHLLIDGAGIDIVHGHSSHHPRRLETYHGKLVMYGCGDLLNDYEGISSHEEYRPDLSLLYVVTLEAGSGRFCELEMYPMHIERMRLRRASDSAGQWLASVVGGDEQIESPIELTTAGTLKLEAEPK